MSDQLSNNVTNSISSDDKNPANQSVATPAASPINNAISTVPNTSASSNNSETATSAPKETNLQQQPPNPDISSQDPTTPQDPTQEPVEKAKDGEKPQTLADVLNKNTKPKETEIKTNIRVRSVPRMIAKYVLLPAACVAILIYGTVFIQGKYFTKKTDDRYVIKLTPDQRANLIADTNARYYLSDLESTIRLYNSRHNDKYPVTNSFKKMISIIKKSGDYKLVISSEPTIPTSYVFQYCSSKGKDYSLSVIKTPKDYTILGLGNDKCTPKP